MIKKKKIISAPQGIVHQASLMSLGTIISRILGLVRDILLSSLFPKALTDVFLAAFRFPQFFRRILGEGALGQSFLPLLIEIRGQNPREAQKFSATVLGFILIVSTFVSVFIVINMDWILPYVVDRGAFGEEKFQETLLASRILFPYLIFILLFAYYMSVLNSIKKFFLPGLTPAFLNLALITFCLIAYFKQDAQTEILSLGVLVGGFFQTFFLFWAVKKKGLFVLPSFQFQRKDFRIFLRKLLPAILGFGVLHFMSLINLHFSSSLGEGVISYFYFAERLLELPRSLIAVSLSVALLPALSELAQHHQKLTQTLQKNFHFLLYLTIPSSLGLFFLAKPLVGVIFMRGLFNTQDVVLTAQILSYYSFLLLLSSSSTVLFSGFYALKNTKFPAVVALITVTVHFILCNLLISSHGFQGLIVANVISSLIHFLLLFTGFQLFVTSFNYKEMFQKLISFLLPNLGLGVLLFFLQDMPIHIGSLAVQVILSLFVYFFISYLLKQPEFKELFSKFLAKTKNS